MRRERILFDSETHSHPRDYDQLLKRLKGSSHKKLTYRADLVTRDWVPQSFVQTMARLERLTGDKFSVLRRLPRITNFLLNKRDFSYHDAELGRRLSRMESLDLARLQQDIREGLGREGRTGLVARGGRSCNHL